MYLREWHERHLRGEPAEVSVSWTASWTSHSESHQLPSPHVAFWVQLWRSWHHHPPQAPQSLALSFPSSWLVQILPSWLWRRIKNKAPNLNIERRDWKWTCNMIQRRHCSWQHEKDNKEKSTTISFILNYCLLQTSSKLQNNVPADYKDIKVRPGNKKK